MNLTPVRPLRDKSRAASIRILWRSGMARWRRQKHDLFVRRDFPLPPHVLNTGWRHRLRRENPAIDALTNDTDFARRRSMELARELRREI